jgi:hypothetical protein
VLGLQVLGLQVLVLQALVFQVVRSRAIEREPLGLKTLAQTSNPDSSAFSLPDAFCPFVCASTRIVAMSAARLPG